MHPSIEHNLPAIAALCRRYGVRKLEIFGSAARGVDFDPVRSDADFLVEFDDTRFRDPLEQFFGFSESLEKALGRPVDLVERGAARNPYFQRQIEEAGELVYEA
jgi:predicted nucleotidyltransferase